MIGLENLLYKFGSKLIRLKGDFSFEEFIDIESIFQIFKSMVNGQS